MRMTTALLNGTEAETQGHKFALSETVGSHYQPSKMKNISSPGGDFDKLVPKMGEGNESSSDEVASLKDLILIHLDFIQQQSEQLTKKNKQLDELRNENDMLKQRLTRMERRVSLQKFRGGDKKPGGEGEGGPRKRRTTTDGHSGKKQPFPPPDGAPAPKRNRPERSSTVRIKEEEPDENENEPSVSLDDTFTSRVAYHTLMGEKPNCLLKYVRRTKKHKLYNSQIEVPQWRVRNLSSSYTMEGTENLSDDVFERRHYKLMGDEKKRKRWDVQRIREQRQIERLRSREAANSSGLQPQYKSLWPQCTEGLRLSVTQVIPVSVFGINIPATSVQDFSLPWKEGTRQINYRRRTKR